MKYALLLALPILLFSSCIKDSISEQKQVDDDLIKAYVSDNNLSATKTASGLYYTVDVEGTGAQPTQTSVVEVTYKGYFLDGKVFDKTDAGETYDADLQRVISGWTEGIPLYKEGGSGTLIVPSALGYGTADRSGIPANSVLVFDVAVIAVK